jgi:hypothetical protein
MPLPGALLALATVGTAQSAGDPPLAPAELGELLGQAGGPLEAQLLLQAAALALQEKAGRLPLRDERALPAASALDERPLVSPAAAGHLTQMLAGEHKEALPEWLAAANSRGLRPPEELLPHLLDLASQKAELRPLLFSLLGPRAVWLAGQAGMGPWAFMRLDAAAQVWGRLRRRYVWPCWAICAGGIRRRAASCSLPPGAAKAPGSASSSCASWNRDWGLVTSHF